MRKSEVDSQRDREEGGGMEWSKDEKLGGGASGPGITEAVQALSKAGFISYIQTPPLAVWPWVTFFASL